MTILITAASGQVTKLTRTFGTMTAELLTLAGWLEEQQVEHLAMESTGVYWYPVYNLLEEGRTVVLVNPPHMKAVPGRKTDVKACSMARRPPAPRPAQGELHPAAAHPRAAGADALPQALGAGAHPSS